VDETDEPTNDPDDTEADLEPDAEQAEKVTGGSGGTGMPKASRGAEPTKR
jgi:hypothetical protein